jgi:glycosyltransferase involved in cell wall biosynthesis
MANTIAAVIPVYNKEPYVARAIASVLAQTRPVDEIIIVDDASTDGGLARIAAFRDARIRLLRRAKSGPGPSPARNLAIRSARSEWIAFLDADDEWDTEFIEELANAERQASETVGCLFTGWRNIWTNGSITRDEYSEKYEGTRFGRLNFDTFISNWLDLDSCPMCASAIAIRRDILLAAGLFPTRCVQGEDKDTWVRVMALTDAMGSSRVCSSYYRETTNQHSRTGSSNLRHCLCATLEEMISNASARRRRLLMRLFNHQVFEYARHVAPPERVSPDIYRGFFVSVGLQRYLFLLALSYLPLPMLQLCRSCILGTRRLIAKAKSAKPWE